MAGHSPGGGRGGVSFPPLGFLFSLWKWRTFKLCARITQVDFNTKKEEGEEGAVGLSIKSLRYLCEICPFSKTRVCTFVQTHQIVKIVLFCVGKFISVPKTEGRLSSGSLPGYTLELCSMPMRCLL